MSTKDSTARKRTPPPRPPKPSKPQKAKASGQGERGVKEARKKRRPTARLFRKTGPPVFRAGLPNARQNAFLAAFAQCGRVSEASAASGVPTNTHNTWMQDATYREKYEEAKIHFGEILEAEADRRAFDGFLKPIYHKGELVGYERRYSDALLMFRLKALLPDRYRERSETIVSGSVQHDHEHKHSITVEERQALILEVLATIGGQQSIESSQGSGDGGLAGSIDPEIAEILPNPADR